MMTDAELIVTGNAIYLRFEHDGVVVPVRVKVSKVPDKLDRPPRVNIVAVTLLGLMRLSPDCKHFSIDKLAEFLAHEWYHAWQAVRWARIAARRLRFLGKDLSEALGKSAFGLMYLPRLVLRGHRAKSTVKRVKGENEIEGDAYRFDERARPAFVLAAAALKKHWEREDQRRATQRVTAHSGDRTATNR